MLVHLRQLLIQLHPHFGITETAAVTTGASSYTGVASGTARTGIVFDLGAAVPEPSSLAFLGLVGLVGLRRKR